MVVADEIVSLVVVVVTAKTARARLVLRAHSDREIQVSVPSDVYAAGKRKMSE